ncbi:unnamed protein product [Brassica napus]|uniref:(rape) hypothetical protein n=1 Tax=Brassica napus TaxID=3708 RepID=A0A816U6F8_BRANA|nr:unnamed protein product [Brassica napus]
MGTSSDPIQDGSDEQQKRSEIYTYEAPWQIYAMNWSVRCDKNDFLRLWRIADDHSRVELKSCLNSTFSVWNVQG